MNRVASDIAAAVTRGPTSRQGWLAVLLAVAWFTLWGFFWSPEPFVPFRSVSHFVPHARFLPGQAVVAGGAAQGDLRVMWSPVLFALPTPMGFSRAPSDGEGHDRPRVQRPSIEPLLLSPPPAMSASAVVTAVPLPTFADGAHFQLDEAAPVFALLPANTNLLTVEIVGDLAGFQALEKPLPVLPPELTADSWTVIAHIDLDRFGNVRHVFLDPPSSLAAFNAQLLQALYRWRFAAITTEVHGAIHLHHAAVGHPSPPASENAKP